MSNHSTVLRHWIVRHNAGDQDATDQLLIYSEDRFRTLARRRLRQFQCLRRYVDTGDVLVEAQIRFARALRKREKPFASLTHFLSFGALKMRQSLLDLKKKYFGPYGDGRRQVPLDPDGPEPVAVASALATQQVDVDEVIDSLSPEYREVLDLLYYQGLPPADAADALNVSVRTFRRRLDDATAALGAALGRPAPDSVADSPAGCR